ncbi:hypothetical protein CapIbe_003778 [Capra ibex]
MDISGRTLPTGFSAPHSSTLAWKIPWMEELEILKTEGRRMSTNSRIQFFGYKTFPTPKGITGADNKSLHRIRSSGPPFSKGDSPQEDFE